MIGYFQEKREARRASYPAIPASAPLPDQDVTAVANPDPEFWKAVRQEPITSTPSYQYRYFHGYRCTEDCSGHEAGYDWAEEREIDDPDDCDGNSDSFIEGCQAYAEEQAEPEQP